MNSKYLLKKRRGISPLLATIIVLAITLAIGGFVYAWTFGLIRTGSAVADYAVTDVKLLKTSGGDSYFSITVKNTGTVTASTVNVTAPSGVTLDGASSFTLTNLAPGHTNSTTVSADGVDVGKTYVFTVKATFSDGSVKSQAVSVICQQA